MGIGYVLYAAGMLCLFRRENREEGFGFMDDVAALKWAKTVDEAHNQLQDLMIRHNGILEWAQSHNCSFGLDKFQLTDFTRRR